MQTNKIMFTALMSAFGFVLNFLALPVAPNINLIWGEIPIYIVAVTAGPLYGAIAAIIGQAYTIILWGPGAVGQMGLYAILAVMLYYLTARIRLTAAVIVSYLVMFEPGMWLIWRVWQGWPMESMYIVLPKVLLNALLIAVIVEGILSSERVRRLIPDGDRYDPKRYGLVFRKAGLPGPSPLSRAA